MSINFAILGILSCRPLTGYDLKKIIQDSPFMYWSGNNNQIYKALVELLEEGWVTNEVEHQDGAPTKKIYTITDKGRSELKRGVLAPPEPPEMKKSFLIRLAWADLLNEEELDMLLTGYEDEILMQLALQQEKKRRAEFAPERTPRESLLWDMIHENILSSYNSELLWVRQLRGKLGLSQDKEMKRMNYEVVTTKGTTYLEYADAEAPIGKEQDALDLVGACMEQDTYRLMLRGEALSEEFFKLRNGLAGAVLQKFVNYRIKVAVVLADPAQVKGKAKELLVESNKGNDFRVFDSKERAEEWLFD